MSSNLNAAQPLLPPPLLSVHSVVPDAALMCVFITNILLSYIKMCEPQMKASCVCPIVVVFLRLTGLPRSRSLRLYPDSCNWCDCFLSRRIPIVCVHTRTLSLPVPLWAAGLVLDLSYCARNCLCGGFSKLAGTP